MVVPPCCFQAVDDRMMTLDVFFQKEKPHGIGREVEAS